MCKDASVTLETRIVCGFFLAAALWVTGATPHGQWCRGGRQRAAGEHGRVGAMQGLCLLRGDA